MIYVHDSVWGSIKITPLMQSIINTYEFQRLRNIRQLGAAQFIFPCATHTRYEHCLGTSHVAGLMASQIYDNPRKIELIRIAGLLHDVGHGPMSHTFDHYCDQYNFFEDPKYNVHENRSVYIIRKIISKYKIDVTSDEVDFICSCITKKSIINGTIDADRIDYIFRDSLNTGINIVCTKNDINIIIDCLQSVSHGRADEPIKKLLDSRDYLYKTIYYHEKTKKLDDAITFLMHTIWKEKEKKTSIEEFLMSPFNDIFMDHFYSMGDTTIKEQIMKILIMNVES